jgi:hypothetical protein
MRVLFNAMRDSYEVLSVWTCVRVAGGPGRRKGRQREKKNTGTLEDAMLGRVS